MSIQLRTPTSYEKRFNPVKHNPDYLLHYDGTLNLDYKEFKDLHENALTRFTNLWKFFKREFVVSPLFLGLAILTILVMPKKLFQDKVFNLRTLKFLNRISKRLIDLLGSIIGILLSSLLFAVLPILIRLDSAGRIFYKQTRIGRNRRKQDRRKVAIAVPFERRKSERRKQNFLGKPFQVYKFRSMKENAEKKVGPVWASQDDPRVTNVGRVLRLWHLDEIPQFINVLKGEMSLVGPRPERPELIYKLKDIIPNYEGRFKSKPGITGLAQIKCGYDRTIEDVKNKLQYDLHYVRIGNMTMDFKILLLTLKEIVPHNGHHSDGQILS
ncbi:MAG: sugar transferase [bacterium]